MTDLVLKAKTFATAAHAAVGQKRKYTGENYIVHPASVSGLVATFGGTEAQIAAAWLHDTVEDTHVTLDDILLNFGSTVCDAVEGLTDVSVASDGNRAARKAIDREHSAQANRDAQFVKLADIIDNSKDIAINDPKFGVVYKKEMQELLKVLTKVKDTVLYNIAVESVSTM